MAKSESKAVVAAKVQEVPVPEVPAEQAAITVGAGSAEKVAEKAALIVLGQKFPFKATLKHKCVKPLLVPSTGLSDVIARESEAEFKIKSFEQAWVLVTDLAALATRYESTVEDFAVITCPPVAKAEPEPVHEPAGDSAGSSE